MKRLLPCLLCVAIAVCTCCVPQQSNKKLQRALKMHQSDIPVPLSYRFLGDKSRIETFSSFRLCEMIYKSPPDASHGMKALKDFYTMFMPAYGWKKLEHAGGRNSLLFQKNSKQNEFCRIDIFRKRSVTTLYILVGNRTLVTAD